MMPLLKIVQIVPAIAPIYGGPSQMVTQFSAALARQGVQVTVLTTTANGDAGQPPLDVPLIHHVAQDGYQIRYFRCAPFRRYKFSAALLRWLNAHSHTFDVAHIHALFSPLSSVAAAIARYRHLPYLLRPLGTLDPADLQKKRRLKHLYAHLLEAPNLDHAAAIHFTSTQEAEQAHRFGATAPAIVLPIGVSALELSSEVDLLQPFNLPADRPIILFMSRLDRKKGLDLLLPALTHLHQQGVLFHLVIAGDNPQEPGFVAHIRDRVRSSPLQSCTTLTGFVTGALKAALLQRADLFVLPSYYENFGIAAAEAMMAGCPVVVSTNVAIAADIALAGAGWIVPCQVLPLAEAIRAALLDSSERTKRGQMGQRYAQTHYDWDAIAQQAIRLYHQIHSRIDLSATSE